MQLRLKQCRTTCSVLVMDLKKSMSTNLIPGNYYYCKNLLCTVLYYVDIIYYFYIVLIFCFYSVTTKQPSSKKWKTKFF